MDVERVFKQISNKQAGKRLISRQEAMVLLSDLDLFTCSETIENVSISKSVRIRKDATTPKSNYKKFIDEYEDRPNEFDNYSLEQYFNYDQSTKVKKGKKLVIPNFVGVNGYPMFPLTYGYARHILIVNKPWRTYPISDHPITEAQTFLQSEECPQSVRIPYMRAVSRHTTKMTFYEPKAQSGDHSKNPVSDEDMMTMLLYGLKGNADDIDDFDEATLKKMQMGKDFNWGKPPKVSCGVNFSQSYLLPMNLSQSHLLPITNVMDFGQSYFVPII